MNSQNQRIRPVEAAGGLDNSLRRWIQNPQKILKSHVKNGMTVLDLGCGPGFFTIEMAKLVSDTGKVIAADLQEGMLNIVRKKIDGSSLSKIIETHQCKPSTIGINQKVDFILAFYMIHEVADKERLFVELKSVLKPGGLIYIVEPKFHVGKSAFTDMLSITNASKFKVVQSPRIPFSRAVVLAHDEIATQH